jgi:hypothetical protein
VGSVDENDRTALSMIALHGVSVLIVPGIKHSADGLNYVELLQCGSVTPCPLLQPSCPARRAVLERTSNELAVAGDHGLFGHSCSIRRTLPLRMARGPRESIRRCGNSRYRILFLPLRLMHCAVQARSSSSTRGTTTYWSVPSAIAAAGRLPAAQSEATSSR